MSTTEHPAPTSAVVNMSRQAVLDAVRIYGVDDSPETFKAIVEALDEAMGLAFEGGRMSITSVTKPKPIVFDRWPWLLEPEPLRDGVKP
jgi:hypothetical protein